MATERLLKFAFSRVVKRGSLEIVTTDGQRLVFGDGGAPDVVVRFTDRAAEYALLLNPALRLGELYMDGRLVLERGSIYELLEAVLRDAPRFRSFLPQPFGRWRSLLRRVAGRNGVTRAKRNVAHHYDLDGRLYSLFLDADQQYSCAYFESAEQSLEQAQLAKKRHIAAKLCIEPGQSVLDIGCGWGGLGLYLATIARAGHVTGITLSEEQVEVARRRAAEQGLSGPVSFELKDYRDVQDDFDRIVSVGMFEHVGAEFYDTFFRTCAQRLADDGIMLLHTIAGSGMPGPTNAWIRRYIFPGGHIPTLSEIAPAIEKSGLVITDLEILRLHYADTLRAWRERFLARRDEAARLYDERFCRMWDFYLSACEAAFRYEDLVVFQIQLTKRNDVVPLTRRYIEERENELRSREEVMPHVGAALRRRA